MGGIGVRPEAVEATITAFKRGGSEVASSFHERLEEKIEEAIAAFCEAEGLWVEQRPVVGSPVGTSPLPKEQRLVGPWRDVEVRS